MLDLAPHLIFIIHLVVQSYHHDTHPVLGCGGSLGTIDLSIGEQVTLKGSGHLLFHLFACCSGIYCDHHTLTDGEGGELILRHHIHTIDTQHEQDTYDKERYGVVFQRPFQP